MNRCEICGKEYQAVRVTSRYCSDKCKQASYRNKGVSVTDISVTDKVSVTPVEITENKPESVVTTQSPTHEVGSGLAKSLDTIAEQPCIKQPDISKLPAGVSKPTGRRTMGTHHMIAHDLRRFVSAMAGMAWIASAEYAEVIHRRYN